VATPLRNIGGSDHLPVSVDLEIGKSLDGGGAFRTADAKLQKEFADAKEERHQGKLMVPPPFWHPCGVVFC
jgi:hypothetical protein